MILRLGKLWPARCTKWLWSHGFSSWSQRLIWFIKQRLQNNVTDHASYPCGTRCSRDIPMKRDGHDPALQSACSCVGRSRFAKASILLLKKASVSSIIAQRKPADPKILFPTLIDFMSNLMSVEVNIFTMFSFNSFVSKLALVCVQPQAINKLIAYYISPAFCSVSLTNHNISVYFQRSSPWFCPWAAGYLLPWNKCKRREKNGRRYILDVVIREDCSCFL